MLIPERENEPETRAALPKWLRGLRWGLDIAAAGLVALAMAVLVLVFGLMNVEIVSRTLFGVSTLVADEYGGYGFAVLIMAGLTYAHRSGALLHVDFGRRLMGARTRAVSLALASALSFGVACFAAYVGYKTWALSLLFGSTSAFSSNTPLWLPQAAVPAGFAILALSFAEEFLSRALIAARGA
ncbi:TRAP transporter small permease [Psychromarinibacter sp. C21-152]|uniref:TRAP transporter small permease protein n=1 Tax=Psychromarinibacter sediminicola TaxID=3033385 RepID=A0AAE3NWU4_9RHOB|nr:TRAP transporter small permease [Psychromarinibacter sediminicola]MDF0602087.1 TRAP transporter small permease [Psychromarinibacter sediminicola]